MANQTIIAIAAGLALTLLPAVPTLADTPPEVACFEEHEVARTVVLDSIGTVMIGTRLKGKRSLKAYAHKDGRFEFDRKLPLLEETRPLSSNNCLRAPAWGYFAGGRYPVVDVSGSHLQVVIDPVQDRRVWLDRRELLRDFYADYELFGSAQVESLAILTSP